MKIKIIKEKKIKPLSLPFPTNNPIFTNIQQASTNPITAVEGVLNVFMHREVYDAIWQHANLNRESELGGSLIGFYAQDPDTKQKFILITDVLNQPLEYYLSPTDIRFTSQFYEDLSEYLDDLQPVYPDLLRLGLYHTHPNYGVFLSKTDARTFKGIFKEVWQIAMIVDPVKEEDAIFFWQNGDISPQGAYYLYETKHATYQPHIAKTTNKVLAKYNAQLSNNGILNHTNKVASKAFIPQSTKPKRKLEKIKIQPFHRSKISIHGARPLQRMCPLFDMHYVNQQIKLRNYIQSLQVVEKLAYPFMIFIQKDIIQSLQTVLQSSQEAIGILKGQFCFDKLKDQYFLMIDSVKIAKVEQDLFPSKAIQQLLWQEQAQKTYLNIGWIYATRKVRQPIYSFFENHKQMFKKNHQIGIILPTQNPSSPNLQLEHVNLIAYNFDKLAPFEYFPHLFVYQKPY